MILLMELKPYKHWDNHHPWWCRILSINSINWSDEQLLSKLGANMYPRTLKYTGMAHKNSNCLMVLQSSVLQLSAHMSSICMIKIATHTLVKGVKHGETII